ncbi:flagellar biosynthesis anti-sigma factor FlgM [bacterium]|nr:flagellar biosynthesis anti-sigma factor FlgM [bacterium]
MKVPGIRGLISIARNLLEPRRGQADEGRKAKPGGLDKVELSSQSQEVQRLAAARSDGSARMAAVAEVKKMYDSGELKADSSTIAEEMTKEGIFDDFIDSK